MSSESDVIQSVSTGKIKKIKLSNEKTEISNSLPLPKSTGELGQINHEILIDDRNMEEQRCNDSLNSVKSTNTEKKLIQLALPAIITDHNYIFSHFNGTEFNLLSLRKDLFCVQTGMVNPNVVMHSMKTSNSSMNKSSNKAVTIKEKTKLDNNSSLKLKTRMTCDKVNPGYNFVNCNGMVDTKITSENFANYKSPVMLKKVDAKSVPPEIKAKTLLKSNMNLPTNCIVNQVLLKQNHSPLKQVTSYIDLTSNEKINENKTHTDLLDVNLKLQPEASSSSDKRVSGNNMEEVLVEQKPPEIKARTSLKSNMNLPTNCIVNQVLLKQYHSPFQQASSYIDLTLNKEINKIKTHTDLVDVNLKLPPEESSSSDKRLSANNMEEVIVEQKPPEIKARTSLKSNMNLPTNCIVNQVLFKQYHSPFQQASSYIDLTLNKEINKNKTHTDLVDVNLKLPTESSSSDKRLSANNMEELIVEQKPPQIKARTSLKSNMNLPTNCIVNPVLLKQYHSPFKQATSYIDLTSNKKINKNKTNTDSVDVNLKLPPEEYSSSDKRLSANDIEKVIVEQKPPEIEAETLLQSNMNLPSNCTVNQLLSKQNHSPLKQATSYIDLTSNKKINKNKTHIDLDDVNLKLQPEDSSSIDKSISANNVEKVIVEQKNQNFLSNKTVIKTDNQKEVQLLRKSIAISEDYISKNQKKNRLVDVSEVRLSSLANISQVDMAADVMTASASNNGAATNNIDLIEDNSDKDSDEELGLNSLEELQQFWELLVDMHDYNKQVIRAEQNKKRRSLSKIKKLEHNLQENFGIALENFEEDDDESSDASMKEVDSKTEENNVILKKNDSMEEE